MKAFDEKIIALVDKVSQKAEVKGALKSISTQTSILEDSQVEFIVHCVDSLERKEAAGRKSVPASKSEKPVNPFLPYDKDLFVTDISETHVCLLNKFNVVPRHLLLVTKAFESQSEHISKSDLEAAIWGLQVMDGLVFFNGGEKAGASQPHKHLQMVPLPQWKTCVSPMEKFLLAKTNNDDAGRLSDAPFPVAAARVDELVERQDFSALHQLYLNCMKQLNLIKDGDAQASSDYNFLLTRRLMWVVPRTEGSVNGVGVNSLGYAGTILLKRIEQLDTVKSLGAMKILALLSEA